MMFRWTGWAVDDSRKAYIPGKWRQAGRVFIFREAAMQYDFGSFERLYDDPSYQAAYAARRDGIYRLSWRWHWFVIHGTLAARWQWIRFLRWLNHCEILETEPYCKMSLSDHRWFKSTKS